MYIPSLHRHLRAAVTTLGPAVTLDAHGSHPGFISPLCHLGLNPFRFCDGIGREEEGVFQRRQFSDNPSKNTNITIGVVVGILLAAFIAAVAAFLYIYGRSIRFTGRKKRRRHHRHKYYSSRSSRSSDGAPPPPNSAPPPPGPPPPAREGPPPKDPPPGG